MGQTKEKIELFNQKKDCCGCGACMNICSKKAIMMQEDEYGFIYPVINHEKCVRCGMCKKVCGYQNKPETREVMSTWVAAAKDDELIKNSASGGIFAAIAQEILKSDGSVFGCAYVMTEGILTPKHIKITKTEDLIKLQGSKYVQSFIGDIYSEVKHELLCGKMVLFSGTPCQVAALNSYLGKSYENLLTVDIICHGVPSVKFFQAYLKELEKNLKGNVVDFRFRDKTEGWGLKGKVLYIDKSRKIKTKLLPVALSSYYKLFLKSETYRENCYFCKYASRHRSGDLTIGDYWGIEKEHPNYLVNQGGAFDENKGISCVLVNTENGKRFLENYGFRLEMKPSIFSKAAAKNAQLHQPSHTSQNRENIMKMYSEKGYGAVEAWYYKQMGIKKHIHIIWNIIPVPIRKLIKKR